MKKVLVFIAYAIVGIFMAYVMALEPSIKGKNSFWFQLAIIPGVNALVTAFFIGMYIFITTMKYERAGDFVTGKFKYGYMVAASVVGGLLYIIAYAIF